MDPFDIIAVIVGVMFTLRKLDTQSRTAAQQPNVREEDFLRWQGQAASAYTPGAFSCFFREIFHFGFARYVGHHPLSPMAYARIGLMVDALWVICVITSLVRSYYANELRRKLGITLDRAQPTP